MMRKENSAGVQAFASLCIFYSIFLFLIAFVGLRFSKGLKGMATFEIFALIESVAIIIPAIGILFYLSWARKVFLVVAFVFSFPLLSDAIRCGVKIEAFGDDPFYATVISAGLFLLHLLSIYYLTRPKVKEQFRKEGL
jgi:hypothetical protein